ncbi:MAG TPA: hypothetical protein VNW97_18800 [Candidatus Saccharimonadales bacterium]|jgi:hypothetical protein|nr:hypothetical protein [Candidatus Saccharimonadales bacterium]
MQNQKLVEKISVLTQEQAAAVEQFIDYLQEQPKGIPESNFRSSLDTFIREHSELLRRLAQ